MNFIVFFTNALICTGAIIMALNIKKFHTIMGMLNNISKLEYASLKHLLWLHHILIISFFLGYLIVLFAINSTGINISNLFVSVIFFFGAIFVLLGIILQKRMITSMEAAYQDTLKMNERLSMQQKELKLTNLSLQQVIDEHKNTETDLQRSYDTQTIVNRLLKESLTDASVMDIVNLCLDLVLSLPWLSFESQGCIYLVEDNPNELVMKAHRGFSEDLQTTCATVKLGTCLCGRAAASQKTIFTSHIDEQHDIIITGAEDHGHYCLPIQAKGVMLGLINIYVEPGHKRNVWEETFLNAVANTMAIILIQHYGEAQNKSMEERLSQSQKMESIGTLASGIAHDFNNILSGIFGHAQLAGMNLDKDQDNTDKIKRSLTQIHGGAKRASDLIQQILTFSRQTEYEKSPIKLYLVVKEVLKFMRSSIPTTIQIKENIISKETVKADPTQIHQIVMNLCTNASHAMQEKGGDLSVSLTQISVHGEHDIADLVVQPGEYLRLEISDTGHGMTPEILKKIFDPYFTTKRISEGTGLGLAVVLGIVEEHSGYIKVESRPTKGSTFKVYLPILEENPDTDVSTKQEVPLTGGSESILLVDDENSILSSTTELLQDFGYSVTAFLDPVLANNAFKDNPDNFDLLITDMTMPKITGDKLCSNVLAIRKEFPIILCTGYSDKISKNSALEIGIKEYLQKPIDSQDLIILIRDILDETSPKST